MALREISYFNYPPAAHNYLAAFWKAVIMRRREITMKKALVSTLLCFSLAAALPIGAFAQELTVGGQVVGIQISTDGVIVAGVSPVETADGSVSPAEEAGLCEGDIIIEAQGKPVKTAAELIDIVNQGRGAPVELTVQRQEKGMKFSITPVKAEEEQWRLGMWLRDSVSGIGTLTFCDPETGIYGALGHSISGDSDNEELPISKGKITDAEIISIEKGAAGKPGELNGCADAGRVLGSVEANDCHGIYGRLYTELAGRRLETGEMCTGPASILCTVAGRQTAEYSVQISRVYNDADGRHAMICVTDPELCALTGGIVQGMSGSPILQDGKLVGAVTHVFINDPQKGYGICIQDMLSSAGLSEAA